MDLHGRIEANLAAAVRSARRLRGHPIHSDTVRHWTALLHEARRRLQDDSGRDTESLQQLVADLETELVGKPVLMCPMFLI